MLMALANNIHLGYIFHWVRYYILRQYIFKFIQKYFFTSLKLDIQFFCPEINNIYLSPDPALLASVPNASSSLLFLLTERTITEIIPTITIASILYGAT